MAQEIEQVAPKFSTWKSLTHIQKNLTVLSIVLFLTIILGFVLYNSTLSKSTTVSHTEALLDNHPGSIANQNVCLTSGCIRAASSVLKNMDPSTDPCEDFYQFACGNFLKTTNLSRDQSSITSFTVAKDLLQHQLRKMMEAPQTPTEPKPFALLKRLYQACMNETEIELDNLKTMKSILHELGGWPVLEGRKWNRESFDWIKSVARLRKSGYSPHYFIRLSVKPDVYDASYKMLNIDQGDPIISSDQGIFDYMVDIAVIFGAKREVIQEELYDTFKFIEKLRNISLPNSLEWYHHKYVFELEHEFPSIPWLTYFNSVLAIPDYKIKRTDVVRVRGPTRYISKLEKLLINTPKRVQANYLMWRVVNASIPYLTQELRQRQARFVTNGSRPTKGESRWRECVTVASDSMPIAADALYVRTHFDVATKKKAIEIVSDIKNEFVHILKKADWIDKITKKRALEKAAAMSFHIAYPEELMSDKKLEWLYKGLDFTSNSYLEMLSKINLFKYENEFKMLQAPNPPEWTTRGKTSTVQAYYHTTENSIELPAGLLQGTFFGNDRPRYMNYGTIGFVIGHEMTHGFDDHGRKYNKHGEWYNWWAPSTTKTFLNKAQCMVDQYGNQTIAELGLNLDGIKAQGENIADNGGIREAYLAYIRWVKRNGNEPVLPGLNYTHLQLFWISNANMWCAKESLEFIRLQIEDDIHSPKKFRVNIPFGNTGYFAEDFNCPIGSKMNPVDKCVLWK
uniref:Peptidase M13 N-terminal domain-containing protein n=1 Tax=Photinus pyralis TaxID=7054 RepID=A0A1Y1LRH1_PHOPY